MVFDRKLSLKLTDKDIRFPIEILNLKDITELEIIGGNFNYFPEDIVELKYLKKLSVVSTKIAAFPKEVFELPELEYLSLKNNRIETLPLLDRPSNITTLILNHNYVSQIDQATIYLGAITTLDLGHNLLENVSDAFFLFKNLKRLSL